MGDAANSGEDGFVLVAGVDEVTPRRPACVIVRGMNIVLFRLGDEIVAAENLCPHQHTALLHQGTRGTDTVTCPMHGWTFDLRTGNALNGNGRLRLLQVRQINGGVWVEPPAHGPAFTLFDT